MTDLPSIHWTEGDQERSAQWLSERSAPPPKRVVVVDDTLTADIAFRQACEGTAMLWRGDFQNAKQLWQALARRIDKQAARRRSKRKKASSVEASPGQDFNQIRQGRAQRANQMRSLLIPLAEDYRIALPRAPNVQLACREAWGPASVGSAWVVPLSELLGVIGAHEWRKKGVEIPSLGEAPNNRIHPHFGVFSPVRGEYVDLVAEAPLPQTEPTESTAFDIGTGTGVLAAVLARRGVQKVVATDSDPRALACARENLSRLGLSDQVEVVEADLFPVGQASLIVCNPPWLPARPSSPLDRAIYDEDGRMLLSFLDGLAAHLVPGGEGWLILSDLAEHLGLRSRAELLEAFERANLRVVERHDVKPRHRKASDTGDPLHHARSKEVTSLWRLTVR